MDQQGRWPLIVFEGIDGSGKGTQAKLLVEALQLSEMPVTLFTFPRYETPTGKIVATCLRGEHGNFVEWPPKLAALPFAVDRLEAQAELREALWSGAVVCDRYVHSNVAHQGAKCCGEERRAIIDWIEQFEFNVLVLPRPDFVLWLDMPVRQATELVGAKMERTQLEGLKRDQHEANQSYQQEVATVYAELAIRPEWRIVRCSPTSTPRTPEQIQAEIVEKLGQRFPQLFQSAPALP